METDHAKILRELSSIEDSAKAVLERLSEGRAALSAEAKAQQDAFDAELAEKTLAEIEKARADLTAESGAEIAKIRQELDLAKTRLLENYERQMDARAEEILRHILQGGEGA